MNVRLWFVRIAFSGILAWMAVQPSASETQEPISLRGERDAALQRMIADPTDADAMLAHAKASIALREFEPAVSTLERFLDQYPNDASARLELAISYFALGAYSVADLHFAKLEGTSGLPSNVQRTITQYRQEIEQRTATSGFRGHFAVGAAYSTNASLLSDSPFVFSFGFPLTRAPGTSPEEAFGGTVSARVQHRYDLNTPHGDYWFTEAGLEALHFLNHNDGDFDAVFVRTGPSLSLDETAYGPKLRPFVELDTVAYGGEWLYSTAGVGLQFFNTIDANWSLYASVRTGYRWHDTPGANGPIQRGVLGLAFRPSRDWTVRASTLLALDNSGSDAVANLELGARLAVEYDFDAGIDFADRKWKLSGYVQVLDRRFLKPDPTLHPTINREDLDVRLGLSLKANLVDGFYVETGIDLLKRTSNAPQFQGDEMMVNLALGLDF